MHIGKITFAVVLAVQSLAMASDNVMIDLSVLDNLSGPSIAPHKPMFPVLPPKPVAKKPVVKKMVAKKAVIKASAPEPKAISPKASVEIKAITDDIVVVDREPEAPKPTKEPVLDTPAEAPTIAVPEQTFSDAVSPVEQAAPSIPASSQPEIVASPQPNIVAEPQAAETSSTSLLVDNTVSTASAADDNYLSFAPESDELSVDQLAKLDKIITSFGDISQNKIAIYSYNIDDGVDSFKKKRISLNRAVEVRSHLLKKGLKNFSIKVININADSPKADRVELEKI